MRRPPEAEKSAFVCISAGGKARDVAHRGLREASGDIGFEIEAPMLGPRGGDEISRVGDLSFDETVAEFGADFVVLMADARADGSGDSLPFGTETLHREKPGFDHAAKRAFPAGMCRAYDARFTVGKQHRCAI